MRWGRNRDSELRAALQRCQSRARLAQAALAEFRERFIPAAMSMSIVDATELLAYLDQAENLLAGREGGAV